MKTTVSWTIEPHWRVVSADLIEIGEAFNTVGELSQRPTRERTG